MKNKVSASIVIGIILVIVALGCIGDVFEVWEFHMFFPGWWTLFIIVPAAVGMLTNGFSRGYLVWLVLGSALLVWQLGIIPKSLSGLIVPALMLSLGLAIVFRGRLFGVGVGNYLAFFGGRTPNLAGKLFQGAFCTAIFGGVDLRLDRSSITEDVEIDAVAIMGGIDILLPENVNVDISGLPVFGGIGESKKRVFNPDLPTVRINAIAAFGGVTVK